MTPGGNFGSAQGCRAEDLQVVMWDARPTNTMNKYEQMTFMETGNKYTVHKL